MNDHTTHNPDEYWNLVDSFIQVANAHLDTTDADQVNAAILEAAAQFNAFILSSTESVQKPSERKELTHEFVGHYRKLLEQALLERENS